MRLKNSARLLLRWTATLFGFLLVSTYFYSLSSVGATWVYVLYVFAFLIAILPFFLSKDLMSPICIYSVILVLQITDFALQDSLGLGLRYFPELGKTEVSEYRIKSLFIIMLWAGALNLAYFSLRSSRFGGAKVSKEAGRDSLREGPRSNVVICIFSVVCVLFSLSGILGGLAISGGFQGMIQNMSSRSEAYMGYGYLRILTQFGVLGSIGFLILGKVKLSIVAALLAFFATAMFGGRAAAFLGVILPYIFFYNWGYRKVKSTTLVLVGVIGIFFLLAMETFKFQDRDSSFEVVELIPSVTRGMSDILPSMVYSLEKGNLDFQHGKTFLNIVYGVVPRAMWQSKPVGIGEDALVGRALIGEDYWGLPPGPFGVAYLNFSYFGVVFFALVVGWGSKTFFIIFRRSLASRKHMWIIFLYPFVFIKVFNFFSVYSVIQFLVSLIFIYLLYRSISILVRIN